MPIAPEYLHLVFPDVTFHAWLYGRNSVDPKKKGRSVADQLAEGRDLCNSFNWNVDHEFKDTGISASRHARAARDDFEALLDTIESADTPPGTMRILVAYEASRYYRDLEAYVRLRNACYHAGVLLCYNGQIYDLSKREDRKATAMDAIAAEDEAEGIRDRNLRTTRLVAEAGRPHGRIPYGYVRKYDPDTGDLVGQYEHPTQGAYVLKAFQHIDSGNSLNSLVKWLRSEPEAARADGDWTDNNVKYMLLNRVYLGERMHRGTSRNATWEPITGLDSPEGRAMARRVRKILTDPARGEQRDTRAAHLLTNIALCGECGDHALLKRGKRYGDGRGQYLCSVALDTVIPELLFDAYVEEAIFGWFRDKDRARRALIPDPNKSAKEMQDAQEMLDIYTEELAEARTLANKRNAQGRPLLSLTSLSEKELDLLPKIEELQRKLESSTGVPTMVHQMLAADDPEAVWNGAPGRAGLSLEQKRALIRTVVTVRLFKARVRGVRRIEPGRVTLSFLGSDGFRDRPLRAREIARARAHAPGTAQAAPGPGTE